MTHKDIIVAAQGLGAFPPVVAYTLEDGTVKWTNEPDIIDTARLLSKMLENVLTVPVELDVSELQPAPLP
jgi:hypothetical protein